MLARVFGVVGVALVCSCSGGGNSGSDGGADAGAKDAGSVDAGPFDAGPSSDRQNPRPLGSTGAANGFLEYLPPRYDDLQPRPLLVFWHGIGENGNGTNELSRVLLHGPPKVIDENRWPASRPFIVLSAQHSGTGCPTGAEIHAFLTWAIANYRVDPKQVFLTGLSCGAIGSWDYLGTFTNTQVAAAMLVCGDPGDPNQGSSAWGRQSCGLGNVAIWSVHGDADATVNIANARATMNNLLACPQPPRLDAVFTVIDGGTHDTWTATYDGTHGDIYAWLLAHAKP